MSGLGVTPLPHAEAAQNFHRHAVQLQSHFGKCISIIVANTPHAMIIRISPIIMARCAMAKANQR